MFRIAKSFVKSLEQSVQDTLALSQDGSQLDSFFQSIPPNLLLAQLDPQGTGATTVEAGNANKMLAGLRVVYVDETQLQLQSYFDYIVGINDDPLPLVNNQHGYTYPDYNKLSAIINDSCGNYVKLNIWSGKGGTFRDEYISVTGKSETELDDISLYTTPSTHSEQHKFQPLGFKVQWSPLIAATYTYHILNLNIEQGPAQLAGLIPDEDYIIGCQDGLLATGGQTLLQDIVRSRANHDIILYIYNKSEDCVRPVTVHIGSDGRLGCNVGYGYLHRIPTVLTVNKDAITSIEQPIAPQTLTPSSTSFRPKTIITPSPPPTKGKTSTKQHKAVLPNDYFDEGKDTTQSAPADASTVAPPPVAASKE